MAGTNAAELIANGQAVIGIEFGSTRIKAVLIDEECKPIANGEHSWENHLEDGFWTYSLEEIHAGLKDCYADLKKNVKEQYGVTLKKAAAIGFSAMMHGYLAFDENDNLLVPFRTWRNSTTGPAAEELSALLKFNIPQRWSVSHIYQAILNGEEHVGKVSFMTTLAGYVHYLLTGKKVLGVGDAAGMFPIDSSICDFDAAMLEKFDALTTTKGWNKNLKDVLPKVLSAGEDAGCLTAEGAAFLDPEGDLEAGIPMAPPEGDAGTGMAATNSVGVRTGNVSAGTSIFSMVVLEKPLSNYYEEIDMVTTPSGEPVAMVHCNNCTSDINSWVGLLKDVLNTFGVNPSGNDLYTTLYKTALKGDPACKGLMAYNYVSGEQITHMEEGRPLFVKMPECDLSLANFMRTHIQSAIATLKIGNDILTKSEKVNVDKIYGHGGLFKTELVGQKIMAGALNMPVAVMQTAGEGGPWGMALLASYLVRKEEGETLEKYLANKVFKGEEGTKVDPDPVDVEGFEEFIERYKKGLSIERAAVDSMKG